MSSTPASPVSWRWIAAMWCAGGVFEAGQAVLIMRFAEHKTHAWLPLFATELATWLPWALATPWVIHLARRYTIIKDTTVRAVAVHLAAFLAISVVAEAWSAVLQVLFNPWGNRRPPTFWDTLSITLLYQVVLFFIGYALILAITYLVDSRESVARQVTETARLNEELSKSQLAALRSQMEPHFMFNTLNAIAGLVRDRRDEAAVSMIVGLSEFLRRSSSDSHRVQVTLAEEVEYVQRYLDIQKTRLGDRLRLGMSVPAELLVARVPSLLLQPLVENAIKHGVAERVSGGAVRVTGTREGAHLHLRVYNDAANLPRDWPPERGGVGLANLRTRLQILYRDAAELRLQRVGNEGVEVIVTLPFEEMG